MPKTRLIKINVIVTNIGFKVFTADKLDDVIITLVGKKG